VRAAFGCPRNRFLIAESSIALVFRFLSVPPAQRFAGWQKISFDKRFCTGIRFGAPTL
jgi:hypothetical protein